MARPEELEQAEARLAVARHELEYAKAWMRNEPSTWDLFTEEQGYERAVANYADAAIEVGRLRALAGVEPIIEAARAIDALADFAQVIAQREVEQGPFTRLKAALAAREEAS